jgi:beta-glucosidase/6-phospho-beta-glucosidase/beta-galactosidase
VLTSIPYTLFSTSNSLKFGIHHVDFTDPERPRMLKASAAFLKDIIANNGFVENTACPY